MFTQRSIFNVLDMLRAWKIVLDIDHSHSYRVVLVFIAAPFGILLWMLFIFSTLITGTWYHFWAYQTYS